jgi:hypothetical protein
MWRKINDLNLKIEFLNILSFSRFSTQAKNVKIETEKEALLNFEELI